MALAYYDGKQGNIAMHFFVCKLFVFKTISYFLFDLIPFKLLNDPNYPLSMLGLEMRQIQAEGST